ncbi:hypothetical protein [Synechococcus sp. CS-1327]|nr:hypothetical protein [Synechococcus sp. CS-1327]
MAAEAGVNWMVKGNLNHPWIVEVLTDRIKPEGGWIGGEAVV